MCSVTGLFTLLLGLRFGQNFTALALKYKMNFHSPPPPTISYPLRRQGQMEIAQFFVLMKIPKNYLLKLSTPILSMWPQKSWMRRSSHIQWIHWNTALTLKKCTYSCALEKPWKSLIDTVKVKSYLLTDPISDWVLDSLIGPAGLLLVISHLFAVQLSLLLVGLEKSK